MSWNFDVSNARVAQHLQNLGRIDVQRLVRMADLDSLLTETVCREIFGAHVYVDVPNFATLATNCTGNADEARRLVQGLHIFQRETTRIVEDANNFDGVRIHFQGAKLHALFYRPIDDEEELASRAMLLQLVIRDFTRHVFNHSFPKLGNFTTAAGADIGSVIGTRNGMSGDRELLFLGAPANYAAKIVGPAGTLRVSKEILDALPTHLRHYCSLSNQTDHAGNPLFDIASLTSEEVASLCADAKICWDLDTSRNRVEEDRRKFPLGDISVGTADVSVDIDALSIRSNKRVLAATLFADVAGFTRYVDEQESQPAKERALRVFHGIRREMSRVIRRDFDGVHVQYQGDRLQALFHMPKDNEERIVNRAIEAAIGLQSSMLHTLSRHLPEIQSLSLTIGIDVGTTIISKLGTRGHRDRICIGSAVETAASCEERHCGGEIALSARAHSSLAASLKPFFSQHATTGDFIALNLTADKVERVRLAPIFSGPAVHVVHDGDRIAVTAAGNEFGRPVQPGRSYAK
jgi:class 3 adenylate cyclase